MVNFAKKVIFFVLLSIPGNHVYAESWCLLSYRDLTCMCPFVVSGEVYTPEMMVKEYRGCFSEPFDGGRGAYLNCDSSQLETNFIFTKTLEDCQKWAVKLKPLRDKGKGLKKKGN